MEENGLVAVSKSTEYLYQDNIYHHKKQDLFYTGLF